MEITGYLHAGYPASLGELGRPVQLSGTGGWLLERVIQGTADHDAVGPYPLFCCPRWSELGKDLASLGDRLVSVVLATDPFGPSDPDVIAGFQPRIGALQGPPCHRPGSSAVAVGLSAPPPERSQGAQPVDGRGTGRPDVLPRHLVRAVLVHRHRLTGISSSSALFVAPRTPIFPGFSRMVADFLQTLGGQWGFKNSRIPHFSRLSWLLGTTKWAKVEISCFSRRAFAAQFAVPRPVASCAVDHDGDTVGMVLWYCQSQVGYYHLDERPTIRRVSA